MWAVGGEGWSISNTAEWSLLEARRAMESGGVGWLAGDAAPRSPERCFAEGRQLWSLNSHHSLLWGSSGGTSQCLPHKTSPDPTSRYCSATWVLNKPWAETAKFCFLLGMRFSSTILLDFLKEIKQKYCEWNPSHFDRKSVDPAFLFVFNFLLKYQQWCADKILTTGSLNVVLTCTTLVDTLVYTNKEEGNATAKTCFETSISLLCWIR